MDSILPLMLASSLPRSFFEGLAPAVRDTFFQQVRNSQFINDLAPKDLSFLMLRGFITPADLDVIPYQLRGPILDRLTEYIRISKYGNMPVQLSQLGYQDLDRFYEMSPESREFYLYQTIDRLFYLDHKARKPLAVSFMANVKEVYDDGHYDPFPVEPYILPPRPAGDENYFQLFFENLVRNNKLTHQQLIDVLEGDENHFSLLQLRVYQEFYARLTSQGLKDDFVTNLEERISYLQDPANSINKYADFNADFWGQLSADEKDFWYAAYYFLPKTVYDAVGGTILPMVQEALGDNVISPEEAVKISYWTSGVHPTDREINALVKYLRDANIQTPELIKIFTSVEFLTAGHLDLLRLPGNDPYRLRRLFYRTMEAQIYGGTVDIATIDKYIEGGFFTAKHFKGLRGLREDGGINRLTTLAAELETYYDSNFAYLVDESVGLLRDPAAREVLVKEWSREGDRGNFNRWLVLNEIYHFDNDQLDNFFEIMEFFTWQSLGEHGIGVVFARAYAGNFQDDKIRWGTPHDVYLDWGYHSRPHEGRGWLHINEHRDDFLGEYGVSGAGIAHFIFSTMRSLQFFPTPELKQIGRHNNR